MNVIVARCANNGIGISKSLPWRLKTDMKIFKNITIGDYNNSVIMGRKTWESLPKQPLLQRKNLILSSQPKETLMERCDKDHADNIEVFDNIKDIEKHCFLNSYNETWVIGGSEIYNDILSYSTVKSLLITEIQHEYDVDTYFPQPEKIEKEYDQVWNSMMVNEDDVRFQVKLLWNKKFPLEGKFIKHKIQTINDVIKNSY